MEAFILPSPTLSERTTMDGIECNKCLKRKRSLPLTPPLTLDDPDSAQVLDKAVHVLSTEATALSHVTRLYQTDPKAREGFLRAVETIVLVNERGGKLIICGVGKSGLIGNKMVASMKSLGLATSFMHAAEAAHGDLGDIRAHDAVLFITYSGRTAELTNLIEHIPVHIPIIGLTSHTDPATCQLFADREESILLPAPIHESEVTSFGVAAPTTSAIVALAIGDSLALTVADKLYDGRTADVFRKNHPGGAIGASKKRG